MQIGKGGASRILNAQKRVTKGAPKTPRNQKPRKK